jgi:hypothetical protein
MKLTGRAKSFRLPHRSTSVASHRQAEAGHSTLTLTTRSPQQNPGSRRPMSRTLAEEIIASAFGRMRVRPCEIVTCKVDLAIFHKSSGPRRIAPRFRDLGAKVWDPSKVATAHFAPAVDEASARRCARGALTQKRASLRAGGRTRNLCHTI